MMRYHDQKQVEEERVYSAYTSIAIVRLKEVKKGTQTENLEAEADAKAIERSAY